MTLKRDHDKYIMIQCLFVTFLFIPAPRWAFMVFQFQISSGSVFMIPGQFLWLFMFTNCFFMVPALFLWLFMVPG